MSAPSIYMSPQSSGHEKSILEQLAAKTSPQWRGEGNQQGAATKRIISPFRQATTGTSPGSMTMSRSPPNMEPTPKLIKYQASTPLSIPQPNPEEGQRSDAWYEELQRKENYKESKKMRKKKNHHQMLEEQAAALMKQRDEQEEEFLTQLYADLNDLNSKNEVLLKENQVLAQELKNEKELKVEMEKGQEELLERYEISNAQNEKLLMQHQILTRTIEDLHDELERAVEKDKSREKHFIHSQEKFHDEKLRLQQELDAVWEREEEQRVEEQKRLKLILEGKDHEWADRVFQLEEEKAETMTAMQKLKREVSLLEEGRILLVQQVEELKNAAEESQVQHQAQLMAATKQTEKKLTGKLSQEQKENEAVFVEKIKILQSKLDTQTQDVRKKIYKIQNLEKSLEQHESKAEKLQTQMHQAVFKSQQVFHVLQSIAVLLMKGEKVQSTDLTLPNVNALPNSSTSLTAHHQFLDLNNDLQKQEDDQEEEVEQERRLDDFDSLSPLSHKGEALQDHDVEGVDSDEGDSSSYEEVLPARKNKPSTKGGNSNSKRQEVMNKRGGEDKKQRGEGKATSLLSKEPPNCLVGANPLFHLQKISKCWNVLLHKKIEMSDIMKTLKNEKEKLENKTQKLLHSLEVKDEKIIARNEELMSLKYNCQQSQVSNEGQVTQIQQDHQLLQIEHLQLQHRHSILSQEQEKCQEKNESLQFQLTELKSMHECVSQDFQSEKQKGNQLSQQVQELSASLQQGKEEIVELQKRLEVTEQGTKLLEQENASLKEKLTQTSESKTKLQRKLANLADELKSRHEELQSKNEGSSHLLVKIKNLERSVQQKQNALLQSTEKLRLQNVETEAMKKELSAATERNKILDEKIFQLRRTKHDVLDQCDEGYSRCRLYLSQIQASMESFCQDLFFPLLKMVRHFKSSSSPVNDRQQYSEDISSSPSGQKMRHYNAFSQLSPSPFSTVQQQFETPKFMKGSDAAVCSPSNTNTGSVSRKEKDAGTEEKNPFLEKVNVSSLLCDLENLSKHILGRMQEHLLLMTPSLSLPIGEGKFPCSSPVLQRQLLPIIQHQFQSCKKYQHECLQKEKELFNLQQKNEQLAEENMFLNNEVQVLMVEGQQHSPKVGSGTVLPSTTGGMFSPQTFQPISTSIPCIPLSQHLSQSAKRKMTPSPRQHQQVPFTATTSVVSSQNNQSASPMMTSFGQQQSPTPALHSQTRRSTRRELGPQHTAEISPSPRQPSAQQTHGVHSQGGFQKFISSSPEYIAVGGPRASSSPPIRTTHENSLSPMPQPNLAIPRLRSNTVTTAVR